MTGRTQNNHDRRISSRVIKYIILIVIILMMCLIFLSYYRIDKVTVVGNTYYTEDQVIEKIITSPFDKNSLFLYLKYELFEASEIPFIQEVNITRVSNHEIQIEVYEKSLIAYIKYMNTYVYFDKDGIILESSKSKIEEIPYITGVNFSGFTLFEKLKVDNDDIFDVILDLSQLIQQYKMKIDKINFNEKEEVTLTSGHIKIYLGKKDLYDEQLVNLSQVLPALNKEGFGGKIDMKNYVAGKDIVFKQSK